MPFARSCHGLAFNVNTQLSRFSSIIPCGHDDKAITSLSRELRLDALHLPTVERCLEAALLTSLQYLEAEQVMPQQLLEDLGLSLTVA